MKAITALSTALASNIPYSFLKAAGSFLGLAAYAVDKRHRMIVKHNLHFIFPDYTKKVVTSVSRNVFINTAITFLEIIQLIYASNEHLQQKVEIFDPANQSQFIKNQGRVIFVSAHIGNWEIPPLFVSMYFKKPMQLVARPLDADVLNRLMLDLRTRFGSTIIDKKGALQKLARALRNEQPIGLLVDQDIRPNEAIKANFLGKAVNAAPSVAWLARRYDCQVVPVFSYRKTNGKLVMEIKPPVALVQTQNPKDDVLTNTQIINDAISDLIRGHVDQWFWFHKRWKRYYPEIYPEELKRLKRLAKKKVKKRQRARQ